MLGNVKKSVMKLFGIALAVAAIGIASDQPVNAQSWCLVEFKCNHAAEGGCYNTPQWDSGRSIAEPRPGESVNEWLAKQKELHPGRLGWGHLDSVPTKAGFAFTGWYKDEACTIPFDLNEPIYEDTVVYGGYRRLFYVNLINNTSLNFDNLDENNIEYATPLYVDSNIGKNYSYNEINDSALTGFVSTDHVQHNYYERVYEIFNGVGTYVPDIRDSLMSLEDFTNQKGIYAYDRIDFNIIIDEYVISKAEMNSINDYILNKYGEEYKAEFEYPVKITANMTYSSEDGTEVVEYTNFTEDDGVYQYFYFSLDYDLSNIKEMKTDSSENEIVAVLDITDIENISELGNGPEGVSDQSYSSSLVLKEVRPDVIAFVKESNGIEKVKVTLYESGHAESIHYEGIKGEPVIIAVEPEKEGFEFIGWYTADGTEWDVENDILTDDIELYGRWKDMNAVNQIVEDENGKTSAFGEFIKDLVETIMKFTLCIMTIFWGILVILGIAAYGHHARVYNNHEADVLAIEDKFVHVCHIILKLEDMSMIRSLFAEIIKPQGTPVWIVEIPQGVVDQQVTDQYKIKIKKRFAKKHNGETILVRFGASEAKQPIIVFSEETEYMIENR